MKVKSIVDVITNSSSEVFIAKTEDVKACFLELLGDDILPKNHYYSAETFEKVLEDFNESYENRRLIEEFLSESGVSSSHLLYKFKLSSDAIIALKYFGHTDEEIEIYTDMKDETRNKIRKSIIEKILGKTILTYWNHSWMDKRVIEWFKNNNKEYKHDIS